MNKELKPCPFCGEQEDFGDYRDDLTCPEVICGNCGGNAHGDRWNTRDTSYRDRVVEVVENEYLHDPQDDTDEAYNRGVRDCLSSIKEVKP